jgi:hypothetical protein
MKVSWQVTGIRKDPWANANRIQVEEDKPNKERGYYMHPDVYGQPAENGIRHLIFPEKRKEKKEMHFIGLAIFGLTTSLHKKYNSKELFFL